MPTIIRKTIFQLDEEKMTFSVACKNFIIVNGDMKCCKRVILDEFSDDLHVNNTLKICSVVVATVSMEHCFAWPF